MSHSDNLLKTLSLCIFTARAGPLGGAGELEMDLLGTGERSISQLFFNPRVYLFTSKRVHRGGSRMKPSAKLSVGERLRLRDREERLWDEDSSVANG